MNIQFAGTITENIMQFVAASNSEQTPNYLGAGLHQSQEGDKRKKKRVRLQELSVETMPSDNFMLK